MVRNEVARDGFRWITLVTDSQPEIEIVLSQPHAGRPAAQRPPLLQEFVALLQPANRTAALATT
jgi:hypothetical protein